MIAHRSSYLVCIASLALLGCSSLNSSSSPDVIYDTRAESAKQLQVPPDLTDVSNSEQFILPGTAGGPVTRNTLLPQFASVRFERDARQSWLGFDASPEELWPQLLAFIRSEKFPIEKTEPATGLIVTQWRPASAVGRGSLLKNLVGSDEEYSRLAFRLERSGKGSRLFTRSQAASEKLATSIQATDTVWPASSHDPEATSALLSRFLVYVGIEAQKARGIIDGRQAQAVLNDAIIQTNGSGSHLVIHRGFSSSFVRVLAALKTLEYSIVSSDDGVGRIEFSDDATPMLIELTPTHISEVRVAVTDPDGRKLTADKEQDLLDALLLQLA